MIQEEEDSSPGAGGLTHLDSHGRARMVDISHKPITERRAVASCEVSISPKLLRVLKDRRLPKGDAVTTAELAGVLAAKRTADLIPLCHTLRLTSVKVRVRMPAGTGPVRVTCEARTRGRTGVEMEALTGAAVAALTLYDMCKAVDKQMVIGDLRLIHKSGGRSDWPPSSPSEAPPPDPAPPARSPSGNKPQQGETYAPTNLIHF